MAVKVDDLYDWKSDIWPDSSPTKPLAPVRVGVDRTTGKVLIGWPHVEQSIGTIFATRYHERVLRRWVGSFVPHILGELAIPSVITRFYWAIAVALSHWEPCYSLTRVSLLQGDDVSETTNYAESASNRLRTGNMTNRIFGTYMPRGHLGDSTPESKRKVGLINRTGRWGVG